MIEIRKYQEPDGYPTRYWGVYVDGELLAVELSIPPLSMRPRGKNY